MEVSNGNCRREQQRGCRPAVAVGSTPGPHRSVGDSRAPEHAWGPATTRLQAQCSAQSALSKEKGISDHLAVGISKEVSRYLLFILRWLKTCSESAQVRYVCSVDSVFDRTRVELPTATNKIMERTLSPKSRNETTNCIEMCNGKALFGTALV